MKGTSLFIRHGSAIDCIGVNDADRIGGGGGGILRAKFEEDVISIEGEICQTTSRHRTPNKVYLHTLTFRTKRKLFHRGGLRDHLWKPQYTFSIHKKDHEHGLSEIIVYSDGYCVTGLWAQ